MLPQAGYGLIQPSCFVKKRNQKKVKGGLRFLKSPSSFLKPVFRLYEKKCHFDQIRWTNQDAESAASCVVPRWTAETWAFITTSR